MRHGEVEQRRAVSSRRLQIREGLRILEEALALVEQTGERLYEAELHRLQGELILRDVRTPEAPRPTA